MRYTIDTGARKHTTATMLRFFVPLLLLGAAFFGVMYSLTRDRLVGVTEEEPLRIGYTTSDLPLDPLAEYWAGMAAMRIHLWPQNARVPYGTEERDIWVRGAYNGGEIAFQVEFADDTENRDVAPKPDACAVFIEPADSPAMGQMMAQGGSGNIWHWRADWDTAQHQNASDSVKAVAELITSGPGTQTPLESQNVTAKGEHRDGKWYVVFKRSLSSQQDGAIELAPGSDPLISFAVWDGAKTESFAAKSIAIVRPLILERD
jgi:DMSO reductase family type II enzyme heme b subunit